MEEHKKFGTTDLLMLLAVLFWAVNFSFIKIALREFSPQAFNGLRLFFTSVTLIFVLMISKEGFSVSKPDQWKIILLGISGNTVYQMFFIYGLNRTTASSTSIILAMSPVFVAVLSTLIKQEKIHWAGWMGIFISFIGFYFLIANQGGSFHLSSNSLQGDLLIFIGNIFWALYTVFSKPLLEKISPLKLTTLTMAVGTLVYLPFAAEDIARLSWSSISFKSWASLLYSGLFCLVIGYVIWYASVKRVGNSKTVIYGNITPVLTVLFAYIFLSERLSLSQAMAALVIFLGVYLTRSGYRYFRRASRSEKSV